MHPAELKLRVTSSDSTVFIRMPHYSQSPCHQHQQRHRLLRHVVDAPTHGGGVFQTAQHSRWSLLEASEFRRLRWIPQQALRVGGMATRGNLRTLDLWISAAYSAPRRSVPSPHPTGVPAPTPQEADGACSWADLPHELLVQIFAAQPEPLHNLSGEFVCRAWAHAVCTDCAADSDHDAFACGHTVKWPPRAVCRLPFTSAVARRCLSPKRGGDAAAPHSVTL